MDIFKHIKVIQQIIINRLPKKWRRKQPEQGFEDADDDMSGEDGEPGSISLTDGEKDKTLGINKGIVNTGLIAAGLIVVMALAYNIMDHDNSSEKEGLEIKNEQAADPDFVKKQSLDTDYRDVQAQMQRANQQKIGNIGPNGSRIPGEQNVQNGQQTAARQQGQQVPAMRAVPQQPAYSVPYTLPSALAQIDANARRNAPNQTVKQEDNIKEQEKKNLIDKFKSAIDFSLGGSSDNSPDMAAGSGNGGAASTIYAAAYSAPGDMILQAGTVIPMILFTGINTDNEGQVIAQVQSDVYDTATGTNLLIPMGSRAIGSYQAGVSGNSGRVAITFSTLVFPDGGSYTIGSSMIAVDAQGYNGISGSVDRHVDASVGRSLVNGILSAGFTALSTVGTNKATIDTGGLQQILHESTNIQPTVTVEPGREFNIFVTQPISF